jgi:hypothetical protein
VSIRNRVRSEVRRAGRLGMSATTGLSGSSRGAGIQGAFETTVDHPLADHLERFRLDRRPSPVDRMMD